MKTSKLLIVVFVSMLLLIVGLVFLAWSGPIQMNKKPVVIMICPEGWHHISSGTGQYICKPDPPEMRCAEGWEYFFDGCQVGCNKIIEPPR